MLRSEAISIIKRGLGFRQTQDAAIIAALQEAQRIMETGHTLPSWLLVFGVQIPITAGTAQFDLPTGFIRMHDDYDMFYLAPGSTSQDARVFLPRRNFSEAFAAYVSSGTQDDSAQLDDQTNNGYPQVMAIQSKTRGRLFPIPTVSFTAYMTYYAAAAKLDADIENAWLANAPDVLIGMAGMTVAGNLRDTAAYQQFAQRANLAGKSYMGDVVEDELAGRGLVMGRNN